MLNPRYKVMPLTQDTEREWKGGKRERKERGRGKEEENGLLVKRGSEQR